MAFSYLKALDDRNLKSCLFPEYSCDNCSYYLKKTGRYPDGAQCNCASYILVTAPNQTCDLFRPR